MRTSSKTNHNNREQMIIASCSNTVAMFTNQQRQLLRCDLLRTVKHNQSFSIVKKPNGLRFSSHCDRSVGSFTSQQHQCVASATHHFRVLQTFPTPLCSRYFSSAVEESSAFSQEVDQPSIEGTRTVAEQIDPNGTDLPANSWVQVNNIPPTASLEDMLSSVAKHLNDEYTSKGIIDLEGYWSPPDNPPMLKDLDTSKCVELAYLVISPYGRPTGWRIKFTNRSIAHSFIESTKTKPFKCVWKETEVHPWLGRDEELQCELSTQISDAAIRMENCANDVAEGHCRHLFRRFDLAWEGPSVIHLGGKEVGGRAVPNAFIIRLADASWARTALRELQGVEFRGSVIRLAQFPKQLI